MDMKAKRKAKRNRRDSAIFLVGFTAVVFGLPAIGELLCRLAGAG